MSVDDITVTAQKIDDVLVSVQPLPSVDLTTVAIPGLQVIAAGNVGPQGPPGQWVSMTQAEYDAIISPDPETLYVIIQ